MEEVSSNKRIAKNTVLLYIRSLISMVVGLYTSRIVLEVLGVSDFGLYGAVGSIVTMFTVLNGVLSVGTSRFLTFELGRGDKQRLAKTFSAAFIMHALMAVVLFILLESFGVWFLNNKMNIPDGRLFAAHVVYQLSVLTCLLSLTQVPYTAIIIARERMNIYAYVGLTDGLFKLVMVYSLLYAGFKDNLIAYAVICASWQILLQLFYRWYCRKNFEESKLHIVKDKCIYKSMLSYSLWDLIGQFCATGNTQGINLLINMFFGVTLNAASAISTQFTNAVTMLNNNFTTASNPQIVKSYAVGDYKRFFQLIFNVGKYSFFLIFILALPIALEAPYILSLWLKNVPDHSVIFLRVALLLVLIKSFVAPVIQGVHATGDVKFMNLTGGLFSVCLTLPGIYFLFKSNFPFWTMFIVQFFTAIVGDVMALVSLCRNVKFSLKSFFWIVSVKPVCIALISSIVPILLVVTLPEGLLRLTIVVFTSIVMSSVSILYLGLGKEDREKLFKMIHYKLSNR